MFGIRDYLEACVYRKDFLQEQREWLYLEKEQHEADAQRLESELDRVRQEMAGYLIPEVNDQHLSEVENHLGCHGLMAIKSDYEQRFDDAEKRRVELETYDEIQNYKTRIHVASQDVAELQPQYDALRTESIRWNSSKWFTQLDDRNYFEQEYWAGFFRRFWDWRAVSFLMAHLEKNADLNFETPEQLKTHYRQLKAEYEKVVPEFEDRMAEQNRIADLKSEHEQCVSAPERLLGHLFRDLGAHVLEYMNSMPESKRMELASIDENLNDFMRKEIGLKKQVQYLRELRVARLDSSSQQVDLEMKKINKKIDKLNYKKARGKPKFYSQEDLDRMRAVKIEKWKKRRLKTEKMRRRISDFKKYDKGSVSDDFLWWDLITNGSHGDDIYEVREHRSRFPDWDYRRYRDPWETDDHDDDGYNSSLMDTAADDLASSMADNDAGLFDPS